MSSDLSNVVKIKTGVAKCANHVKIHRRPRGVNIKQNCLRIYLNVTPSSMRRVLHIQWKLMEWQRQNRDQVKRGPQSRRTL